MNKILIILIPLLLNVFAIYYSPKRQQLIQKNIYPIKKVNITSGFGKRKGNFHWGVDFGAPHGTPVIAPIDMEIYRVSHSPNLGLYIVGKDSDNFYYTFAHLSRIQKNETNQYYQGETIGYVGNSGNSFGSHLHYEIFFNGVNFNPINFTKNNFQPKYIDDEIDRFTSIGFFDYDDFFEYDNFFDLSFVRNIKNILYL